MQIPRFATPLQRECYFFVLGELFAVILDGSVAEVCRFILVVLSAAFCALCIALITTSIDKSINITSVSVMMRAFSTCIYANIQLHMTSLHDQHQHHHERRRHLPN